MIEENPERSIWKVRLLGTPEAHCGEQTVHLHSQKTWAVLACLLFPSLHLSSLSIYAYLSREQLAERLWGEDLSSRNSLNTAMHSLHQQFNKECFCADSQTIRAVSGRFITDIEQIVALHAQARRCVVSSERLPLLMQAASEIRGEFLGGELRRHDRVRNGNEAEVWYQACQAEINRRAAALLWDLGQELENGDNKDDAFEIALRAWHLLPDDRRVRQKVQSLARATGRAQIISFLEGPISLASASAYLKEKRDRGGKPTLKEQERFIALVRDRVGTLSATERSLFLKLTFLPAPFSAELGEIVCQVEPRFLTKMVKESLLVTVPILHTASTHYTLPQEIREAIKHPLCASYRVPSNIWQEMQQRLGQLCESYMVGTGNELSESSSPFKSIQEAEPFLAQALNWTLAQPPTTQRLAFIDALRFRGQIVLSKQTLPYLEKTCDNPKYAVSLRVQAGIYAGYVWLSHNQFSNAIQYLDKARNLLEKAGPEKVQNGLSWHAVLFEYLTLAAHYGGDSPTALLYLEQAIKCFERVEGGDRMEIGNYLRMRCEIQNSLGEHHEALKAADEAVRIRTQVQLLRGITGGWLPVADAQFWKAVTLQRLGRSSEAADCLIKALDIRQRTGDHTGTGHCLRELATLYANDGRFAEARSHLEHAISLHENYGSQGCRMAAVSVLGDVLLQQEIWAKAQECYTECLAYAEKRQCLQDMDWYRAKLLLCEHKEELYRSDC